MKSCKLTCLLLYLALYSSAQDLPQASLIKLHSVVLGEERKISIYTPPKIHKNTTYPVLLVLDAEYLFLPLLGTLHFMNYGSSLPQAPQSYIVGIHNTKRDRDMPVPQEFDQRDGAATFLKFISTELLPFLKKNYSNQGSTILVGHSQAGLFATHAGLQSPQLFPFVLSLDAPVTVNTRLQAVLEQRILQAQNLHYVSVENMYGWKKGFLSQLNNKRIASLEIGGETHETMALKGAYEGLKFLFRDFIPIEKDLSLPALKDYYDTLSTRYLSRLEIPSAVLLQSAREKIGASKKQEAIQLLEYLIASYGVEPAAKSLLEKAKAITKEPDGRIDFYLNHPAPSAEQLKPFLGKWKGLVRVPGGADTSIEWEIREVNGRYRMASRVMNEFNTLSDFLGVSEKGELVWGRKHNGGGIYLSVGTLSPAGDALQGVEDLIGFDFPEGFPPFRPNKFEFKKIQKHE